MNSLVRAVAVGVVLGVVGIVTGQTCQPVRAPSALVPSFPGLVNTIVSYDDGSGLGKAFYAGGSSSTLGGVARLTPSGWVAPGGVLGGAVNVLSIVEDGSGPGGRAGLYAGGSMVGNLVRWDGTAWQPVTPAPGGVVTAIAGLPGAEGNMVLHIVVGTNSALFQRLENGLWTTLGIINGSSRWTDRVITLDEDGPGPRPPAIFMGSGVMGITDRTVTPAVNIPVQSGLARWDGAHFTALPLAGNMGSWIKAMTVYDDGINGPSLFVSGHGTLPLGPILRWDTATQTFVRPAPIGNGGGDTAYGMGVLKDGLGSNADHTRMYAIGSGTGLGVTTPNAPSATLNGTTWNPLTLPPTGLVVSSMDYHLSVASGELGAGHVPALLSVANRGTSTSFFAIVGCPRCAADLDLDGAAGVGDIFAYIDAYFARAPIADTDHSGTVTLQDLFDYLGLFFAGCG